MGRLLMLLGEDYIYSPGAVKKRRFMHQLFVIQVEILRAQVKDTAQYTCIASNEAGDLERTFSLEVLGKQTKIVKLLFFM